MNLENISNQENSTFEKIKSATEKVGQILQTELEQKFGDLEYHNIHHSTGVANNALNFLSETDMSDEDRLLVEVSGLGHDIDQSFEWSEAISGIGLRRIRHTGVIEESSKEYVLKLLSEQGLVLNDNQIKLINEAIMGTVPGYDQKLATVIQPNINIDSAPTTWAIAAADLATSGFKSEQFLLDGDAVFNEDRTLPDLDTLSEEQSRILHSEVLNWTKNQITYAEGQQIYWNREIVPDFIKNKLTDFNKSIELCKERYQRRKDMTLSGLLIDMRFTRFEEK